MAMPFLHQYIVAIVSALKVQTSVYKRKPNSAQAIQHFIKKSSVNFIEDFLLMLAGKLHFQITFYNPTS